MAPSDDLDRSLDARLQALLNRWQKRIEDDAELDEGDVLLLQSIKGELDDAIRGPEDDRLGSCGCTDYHMADCPTRTGDSGMSKDDYLELMYRGYELPDEW